MGAGSAALSRGILALAGFLVIPIVIRYLGPVGFGIWTTITTTLTMLLVLDVGIANSLTNFISEAYARNDPQHASRYATTALGATAVIAALFGLAAWGAWPYIRWERIFNVSATTDRAAVSHAAAVALVIFLLDLPARLGAKILGGYQELGAANLFAALGAIGSVALIILMVWMHAGLAGLVAASSGALVAADVACLLWLLFVHKPWLRPRVAHVSRVAAGRLMRQGGYLFMLQIAGLMVFDSDNLIVSHYLGPAAVASYSIAWRLAGYAAAVPALLFPALWPAFSEAFARGEIAWVRSTFRRIMWITLGTTALFACLLAVGGRWLIRVWATPEAVPSEPLLLLMCVWALISTLMSNTVTVLLAKGEIRLQSWLSLLVGVVNLGLSIWLVQRIGSEGVILGTILSYLLVLVVPQTLFAWKILHADSVSGLAAP